MKNTLKYMKIPRYIRTAVVVLAAMAMIFALPCTAQRGYADGELKAETVDLNGDWHVSDPVTLKPGKFDSGDLGLVLKNDKVGFIDSNGKEVIPCKYDNDTLSTFYREGYAVVVKDGKQGIINTSGEEVVPCIYDYIDYNFDKQQFISASLDDKFGFISLTGDKGIPFCFDETWSFGNSETKYGAVCLHGKWGLINAEGKIVLPMQYEYLSQDQGNYTVVWNHDMQGLVGPDLKEILPIEYETVDVVPMGDKYVICAHKDNKSFICSMDGKVLADCGDSYLDYDYEGNSIGVIMAVSSGSGHSVSDDMTEEQIANIDEGSETYTLYNAAGKQITDQKFMWATVAGEAIAVDTGNGCGIIDAAGKTLVPFEYDNIEVIEGKTDPVWFACHKEDSGWTVFNDKGKEVKKLAWMKLTVPEDSEFMLIKEDRLYVSDEEVSYGPAIGDLYDIEGNKLNQGEVKIISRQCIGNTVAVVDDSGKYGIMSLDGEMLIPCEYGAIECSPDKLGKFYFGYQPGEEDSGSAKVTYINSKGKKVTESVYDDPWDSYLAKFTD